MYEWMSPREGVWPGYNWMNGIKTIFYVRESEPRILSRWRETGSLLLMVAQYCPRTNQSLCYTPGISCPIICNVAVKIFKYPKRDQNAWLWWISSYIFIFCLHRIKITLLCDYPGRREGRDLRAFTILQGVQMNCGRVTLFKKDVRHGTFKFKWFFSKF